MKKTKLASPMEASLSKPIDDSVPEGFNANPHGQVFNMPARGVLKHLTEPPTDWIPGGPFAGKRFSKKGE